MKKIVVADDHPIVIEGMKLLFKDHADYDLCGSASTIREVETVCAKKDPALLILDINLQGRNSLEGLNRLKLRFPQMKVLIFSSYDTPGIVRKAIDNGADGYMLKDAPHSEWMEAIDQVLAGHQYMSKSLLNKTKSPAQDLLSGEKFSLVQRLSARERKIIECVVKGQKEQEIAGYLHISKNTVHTHKKNIMRKLSLHSNAEIVKFALENHIV